MLGRCGGWRARETKRVAPQKIALKEQRQARSRKDVAEQQAADRERPLALHSAPGSNSAAAIAV